MQTNTNANMTVAKAEVKVAEAEAAMTETRLELVELAMLALDRVGNVAAKIDLEPKDRQKIIELWAAFDARRKAAKSQPKRARAKR